MEELIKVASICTSATILCELDGKIRQRIITDNSLEKHLSKVTNIWDFLKDQENKDKCVVIGLELYRIKLQYTTDTIVVILSAENTVKHELERSSALTTMIQSVIPEFNEMLKYVQCSIETLQQSDSESSQEEIDQCYDSLADIVKDSSAKFQSLLSVVLNMDQLKPINFKREIQEEFPEIKVNGLATLNTHPKMVDAVVDLLKQTSVPLEVNLAYGEGVGQIDWEMAGEGVAGEGADDEEDEDTQVLVSPETRAIIAQCGGLLYITRNSVKLHLPDLPEGGIHSPRSLPRLRLTPTSPPKSRDPIQIIYLEKQSLLRDFYARFLQRINSAIQVVKCSTYDEALYESSSTPDLQLLITNYKLDKFDGFQLYQTLQKTTPNLRCLLLTSTREKVALSGSHLKVLCQPIDQVSFELEVRHLLSGVAPPRDANAEGQ